MSLRGRVIRRSNVACYLTPQSIQDQKRDYEYLARVLRIPQYDARSFYSIDQWVVDMTDQQRLVYCDDLLPNWGGVPGAVAIQVPVNGKFMLNLFASDIGGTVIPAKQRSGFFYKLANGTWSDATHSWSGSESTVPSGSEASLSVCVPVSAFHPHRNPPSYEAEPPYAVFNLGPNHGHERGALAVSGQAVVECYYTSPFFTLAFNMGSQELSEVMMIEEKV